MLRVNLYQDIQQRDFKTCRQRNIKCQTLCQTRFSDQLGSPSVFHKPNIQIGLPCFFNKCTCFISLINWFYYNGMVPGHSFEILPPRLTKTEGTALSLQCMWLSNTFAVCMTITCILSCFALYHLQVSRNRSRIDWAAC